MSSSLYSKSFGSDVNNDIVSVDMTTFERKNDSFNSVGNHF
jgi:hypothetical protein